MLKPFLAASVLIVGSVVIYSGQASAHPKAMCKFEAFDTCMAAHFPQSWCVAVAEQQCAGHSHGGGGSINPASSDYTSGSGRGLIILNKQQMKLRRRQ
jgi:hypothetical protein